MGQGMGRNQQMHGRHSLRRYVRVAAIVFTWLMLLAPFSIRAEFGDVVFNKHAEKEGVRPVIFPHWFHRIRYNCKVCHSELGFKMRAGDNVVLMSDIIEGKFCGMCHNDKVAWGAGQCDLCHTGRPGMQSGIIGGNSTGGPGRW